MNSIKTISATVFFTLLISSHLEMVIEQFALFFPKARFSFIGTIQKSKMMDLEDGTMAIAADKMNVFYVGVNNPITIAATGVASDNLMLSSAGNARIQSVGEGRYDISCTKIGQAILKLTNQLTGQVKEFKFRVKRIPDPVVRLGNQGGGLIASGEFRAQLGLTAWLDNFDFDAKCKVVSYTMYYSQKGANALELKGNSGWFSGVVLQTIKQAKPGDQFHFTAIKANCPGDVVARRINSLTFKIK